VNATNVGKKEGIGAIIAVINVIRLSKPPELLDGWAVRNSYLFGPRLGDHKDCSIMLANRQTSRTLR
jgi:hypothetical protein